MMDVGEEALDLLTVPQVAARLGCSKGTVWRLVYADEEQPGTGLPSVKLGRLRRVKPEDVKAYKDSLQPRSSSTAA